MKQDIIKMEFKVGEDDIELIIYKDSNGDYSSEVNKK